MKNSVLTTVLASILGFGSTVAIAQDKGEGDHSWKQHSGEKHDGKQGMRGGKHGGAMFMVKHLAKQLSLTDEQKKQVKIMREAHKADNKALRDEMKQLHQDRQNLNPNDATAVEILATRKGALAQKMFVAKNQAQVAFESILTDKQKVKMAEIKAEHQAKMEARLKKRMERRAAKAANES